MAGGRAGCSLSPIDLRRRDVTWLSGMKDGPSSSASASTCIRATTPLPMTRVEARSSRLALFHRLRDTAQHSTSRCRTRIAQHQVSNT